MSNERSAWFTVKLQVLTLSSYNMHLLWKHFGVKHYVAQVNRNESAHMKINRLSEKEKKKKKKDVTKSMQQILKLLFLIWGILTSTVKK